MLVPLNQLICKTCINFKHNSHLNEIQDNDGAAYYRRNSFMRFWFQWTSSQTKQKFFKYSKKKNNMRQALKRSAIISLWQYYFGWNKSGNLQIFEISTKTNQLI